MCQQPAVAKIGLDNYNNFLILLIITL